MNLAELKNRFEGVVSGVAKRINDGDPRNPPQDPAAVLDVNRAELRLRAITLVQDPPLYFTMDMRQRLQSAADVDTIADEFVAKWRQQRRADDSV